MIFKEGFWAGFTLDWVCWILEHSSVKHSSHPISLLFSTQLFSFSKIIPTKNILLDVVTCKGWISCILCLLMHSMQWVFLFSIIFHYRWSSSKVMFHAAINNILGCLKKKLQRKLRTKYNESMRLPGVEPGSIAWKAIILTVGLQTPNLS